MRTLPFEFGRYTLFDHIGRGGMADIYLARTRTELAGARLVVIKEVIPELASNERFVGMLIREAKLAAGLHHANIARVEDLGRHGGVPFVAMEYLEGIDLSQLLRLCSKRKLAFEMGYRLRVLAEVLKALDYAHRFCNEEGKSTPIVHRDVSPSNVLLSFDGEVKLCDFGIACALQSEQLKSETIEGKAGYMSPEQARGDAVDARSDIFACGIILWELVHGRRMYRSKQEPLLALAQRAEIPEAKPPKLPVVDMVLSIARKALAARAEDRYPSASAMARALESYVVEAKLLTSAIRFGDWLTENFAEEQRQRRMARQRVLQALERGPAAVIEAIDAPVMDELAVAEHATATGEEEPSTPAGSKAASLAAPTQQETASPAAYPMDPSPSALGSQSADAVVKEAPLVPPEAGKGAETGSLGLWKWGVLAFVMTLVAYYALAWAGAF